MPALGQKKRKAKQKGYRINRLTTVSLAVIFSAICIIATMAVRAEITALANETALLEVEVSTLEAERRLLEAEYEQVFSPSEIENRALEIDMISPSEVGHLFFEKPTEDMTISTGYKKSDKPKSIWEFFDDLVSMLY